MEISLDDEQADLLRALIEEALGELSYEIAGTDRPAYRQALRRRRDALRTIFAAMTVPTEHASSR
jgi:hypothetical protein